jgi:hypothetical protein
MPFGVCVWSTGMRWFGARVTLMPGWRAGVAPGPFVAGLPLAHGRGGRLVVDEYLRVMGQEPTAVPSGAAAAAAGAVVPDIYAIGDCAGFAESPLPQTAQVALPCRNIRLESSDCRAADRQPTSRRSTLCGSCERKRTPRSVSCVRACVVHCD